MVSYNVVDGYIVIQSKQIKIVDIPKHDLRNRRIVFRWTHDGKARFSSHNN